MIWAAFGSGFYFGFVIGIGATLVAIVLALAFNVSRWWPEC